MQKNWTELLQISYEFQVMHQLHPTTPRLSQFLGGIAPTISETMWNHSPHICQTIKMVWERKSLRRNLKHISGISRPQHSDKLWGTWQCSLKLLPEWSPPTDTPSDINSDMYSDILSGILSESGILSNISSGILHSIWHPFWHSIRNIFWHSSWHSIWHSIWHPFWHSIRNIFSHSIWHSFRHSI